jgi:hypothetical protein
MNRYPLPLRIALAVGGAAVAGYLGVYAAWSWYRASKEEREQLVSEYFDVLLGGGK